MKKFSLIIAIILVIMLAMAGCQGNDDTGGDEGTVDEGDAAANETAKVYLITMDQMDQHWVTVDEGAQKAADELGNIDYKWLAPDVKDDAKQIECINNAVADGADVILLAANGPDAVTSALEEADKAGVMIIYVDSPANFPALQTLATDNKAAGETAGKEMLDQFTADGVSSGKIGIVNVKPDTTSCVLREEGFRAAFEGTDFEILTTQYGEGDPAKSKDIASNYISEGVVGIFGANEGGSVGAGNAIKEAGAEVVGVGFDKSDAILELLDGGYLLCSMAQNPDVMGYEGVQSAAKAFAGEELSPAVVDTGVSVLRKE